MDFGLNRIGRGGDMAQCEAKSPSAVPYYKPRTLREQLQDQIAAHQAKIADLQEAVDSLSPDVEKALNALGKL